MSNAQTRQQIADALTTVPPLRGHAARPAALNEGDAWPQWRGSEFIAGQSLMIGTWSVLIVLPQADDITADGWVDQWGHAVVRALAPVMIVDSLAPATIPGDAGEKYALLVTGRTE